MYNILYILWRSLPRVLTKHCDRGTEFARERKEQALLRAHAARRASQRSGTAKAELAKQVGGLGGGEGVTPNWSWLSKL